MELDGFIKVVKKVADPKKEKQYIADHTILVYNPYEKCTTTVEDA